MLIQDGLDTTDRRGDEDTHAVAVLMGHIQAGIGQRFLGSSPGEVDVLVEAACFARVHVFGCFETLDFTRDLRLERRGIE